MAFSARLLNQTAQVRAPTGGSSNGADVTYAAAVNVAGYWLTKVRKVPGTNGGWQTAVDHWFITVSASPLITRDHLIFRQGVDATVKSNGQKPRDVHVHMSPHVADEVHHYEVML